MNDNIQKSGPLPAQVTYDPLLANVAVAYFQELAAYSTRRIFPVVPVNLKSGTYKIYERGAFYRDDVGRRPRGGELPVTGFGMSQGNYTTEEEGLSTFIDEQDRANLVEPMKLERAKIRLLTQQIHTHFERVWAQAYFKVGVWTRNLAGVAAGPGEGQFLQLDQSGVNIPKFIRLQRDNFELTNGGFGGNALVVGKAVHRAITADPAISDLIKYTQVGVPTVELLKALFGVEEYIVPGAIWNAAGEGQAENFQRIVGERDMLLCHRTSEPSTDAPTAGVTFAWNGLVKGGGIPDGVPVAVNRWWKNPYAEMFDTRMAIGTKVMAADLGIFYSGAVSASA